MLIALRSPADNTRGPRYMHHQVLDALHQANRRRLPISFVIARYGGTVSLFCDAPEVLQHTVENQLLGAYPHCVAKRLTHDALAFPAGTSVYSARVWLRPELFPTLTYEHFEDRINRNEADPVSALFAAVADEDLHARVTIVVRPAGRCRRWLARLDARRLERTFFHRHPELADWYARGVGSSSWIIRNCVRLAAIFAASPRHTDTRQPTLEKLANHLFEARVTVAVAAPAGEETRARQKLRQIVGAFGSFTTGGMATFTILRRRGLRRGFLWSTRELASVWHPPVETVRTPMLEHVESREFEPPVTLPIAGQHAGWAILGRVKFRRRSDVFGINLDDRRRHVAIVGKTGMGKTTLLTNLIASDIEAGRGVAVVDPHGDLAESLLSAIPRRRTNDVIYFDAADREHALAFNILACGDPAQRPLVASGVVTALKKLFAESWGPRLEHILRNALFALLEVPGTSLLSLQRLLSDTAYRKMIVSRVADPAVRSFWQHEFAHWKPQLQAEALSPVQNKVGQFVVNPLLRNIIGQSRSTLDLRRIMDRQQVLIVNLSKGRLGEDGSALLGALLVTAMQLAAMSRAEVPEDQRIDFFAYVDEFQNYSTAAFATALSESRKFRIAWTLAHQYLDQLDEETAAAVFGNVGTYVAFAVGASDAETVAKQLGGDITEEDMMRLPKYAAYVRLSIDGVASRPFSMQTIPPAKSGVSGRSAVIRRTSRHQYSRPVPQIAMEIERMLTG